MKRILLLAFSCSGALALAAPAAAQDRPQDDAPTDPRRGDAEPTDAAPAPAPDAPPTDPGPGPGPGFEGGDIEDASLEELLGLDLAESLGTTTAASRREESVLTAPAAITTLDARAIRASGARTLPDLLRLVPSVQVVQTAPGAALVSLRGLAGLVGNNVVVTLDGVPLNHPLDGSIEWGLVPVHLRDLERIDVVRGPVSTTYGANAYAGVIALTTHRGFGHGAQWAARVEGGVDDRGRPTGTVGARFVRNSQRFERAVFATITLDDAFTTRDVGSHVTAFGRSPDGALTPLSAFGVTGRFAVEGSAGRLEAEATVAAGIRSSLEHFVLDDVPERHLVGTLRLEYRSPELTGPLGALTLFSRGAIHGTESDATTGFSYDGTRALRESAGFELTLEPHPRLHAALGGQIDVDVVNAPYLAASERSTPRAGYGFFGRTQWDPTDRLALTVAVRGDVPTVTGALALSYRGSVVVHGERYGLRVALASAYRAPTYVEAGGSFVDPATQLIELEGEPSIDNPTNDSAEVAVTFAPSPSVRVGATAYASRLRAVVVEDLSSVVRHSFRSDDEARYLVGGELEGSYVHSDGFELALQASYVEFVGRTSGARPVVGLDGYNARVLGSVTARGSFRGDSLRYAATATFGSGRDYLGAFGVPARIIDDSPSASVGVGGLVEYDVGDAVPLWLSLRVGTDLPRQSQSPVPGASVSGTYALVGFEVRRD